MCGAVTDNHEKFCKLFLQIGIYKNLKLLFQYIYIYILYIYIYIYICISAEKYKTNIFHINYLNNRDLQYLLLK